MQEEIINRAVGCLQGVFVGDAFGAQYEFLSQEMVADLIRERGSILGKSLNWDFIVPGQITDDSEMVIALLQSILKTIRISGGREFYNPAITDKMYKRWLVSGGYGIGNNIATALTCENNSEIILKCYQSKANGAMMRVAPIPIAWALYGATHGMDVESVLIGAMLDAFKDDKLTHPNPVCIFANGIYAYGLCYAIYTGASAKSVVNVMLNKLTCWLMEMPDNIAAIQDVQKSIELGLDHSPRGEENKYMGYVLLALQNAVFQLLHANTMEEAIVNSCLLGGDTDTTSCIAGALYGSVYGGKTIPKQWLETVTKCNTKLGGIPREEYQDWTRDVEGLISSLYKTLETCN